MNKKKLSDLQSQKVSHNYSTHSQFFSHDLKYPKQTAYMIFEQL